jgi:hypothetical protein
MMTRVTVSPRIVKRDPSISPLIFHYIYYRFMYPFIIKSKYPSMKTLNMKLKNIPFFKIEKIVFKQNWSPISVNSPFKIPTNEILNKYNIIAIENVDSPINALWFPYPTSLSYNKTVGLKS